MRTEEIKEKFETELKWSSYFFLFSITLSFALTLFELLIQKESDNNIHTQLFLNQLIINTILLFYFTRKCIIEKNKKKYTFLSNLIISLKIFSLNFLLIYLICFNESNHYQLIFPKRELEIQESENILNETNSNLLKDLIIFLKKTKNNL